MTQIGIMIEGQDGLNWTRWKRILSTAEDMGYQCVFRSDHFTNASGEDKDSLELWTSLTYAASHTQRIEFGPLVTPVTFRHPSMTARYAAAIDDLSGGRLILGMGAGWQDREHHKFGIPFYDFPTRYDMLENALDIVTMLLNSDKPVTYTGDHFQLDDAVLLPRPVRAGGPPILIGGSGPKRTLPLVAKYAKEWNVVFLPLDQYQERTQRLNELLAENGRKPSDVKRSLMIPTIFGKTESEFQAKIDARNQRTGQTDTAESLAARGMLIGTPSMYVDQIGKYVEVGVERFMLQWLEQDNIEGLEIIARDVLPHFHK
jgi:F420-dependent oxidoreductase-like protein